MNIGKRTKLVGIIMMILLILSYLLAFIITKDRENKYLAYKLNVIEQMTQYFNNKYETENEITIDNLVYFLKEDNEYHKDMFGFGKRRNLPDIAEFELDGKVFRVAKRGDVISDCLESNKVPFVLAEYYSSITDCDIEYVEIRNASNGNRLDNLINECIQLGYNDRVKTTSIKKLVDMALSLDDVEFIFYVRDTSNSERSNYKNIIKNISSGIKNIKDNANILKVSIYAIDEESEIIIKNTNTDLKKYDDDDYKFGYNYIPNKYVYLLEESNYNSNNSKINKIVWRAYLDIDRGYGISNTLEYQKVDDFYYKHCDD